MKYENAKNILPAELYAQVEKYAAGKLLYVPLSNERRPWGENSGIRRSIDRRNEEIRNEFSKGSSVENLANRFFLSPETVKKIVYQRKESKEMSTGYEYEGILFEQNEENTGYTVVGVSDRTMKSAKIPPEIQGKPVTAIGRTAFVKCECLEKLDLPDSIAFVATEAFVGCDALKELHLPKGLKEMEWYAFAVCRGLTAVTVPEGLKRLNNFAFFMCNALEKVNLPKGLQSIGWGVFEGTAFFEQEENWTGEFLYIGDYLIKAKETVSGHIDIPETVRCVAGDAFIFCKALRSVTVPQGITIVEGYTFYNCASLQRVTLPGTLSAIGPMAFSSCQALKDIDFGGSMADWRAVKKDASAFKPSCVLTVHCTDGEITITAEVST